MKNLALRKKAFDRLSQRTHRFGRQNDVVPRRLADLRVQIGRAVPAFRVAQTAATRTNRVLEKTGSELLCHFRLVGNDDGVTMRSRIGRQGQFEMMMVPLDSEPFDIRPLFFVVMPRTCGLQQRMKTTFGFEKFEKLPAIGGGYNGCRLRTMAPDFQDQGVQIFGVIARGFKCRIDGVIAPVIIRGLNVHLSFLAAKNNGESTENCFVVWPSCVETEEKFARLGPKLSALKAARKSRVGGTRRKESQGAITKKDARRQT